MADVSADDPPEEGQRLDPEESSVSAVLNHDDITETIATMEESQLCFHPVHHHSFSPVNFLLSMPKCAGCDQRLKAVLGSGENQVVRCVACGAYAHRSCAMEPPARPEDFTLMWNTKCPVNSERIETKEAELGTTTVGEEDEEGDYETLQAIREQDAHAQEILEHVPDLNIPHLEPESDVTIEQNGSQQLSTSPMALFQFLSPSSLFAEAPKDEKAPLSVASDDEDDDEVMLWSPEGPPRHWATEQSLVGIRRPSVGQDDDNNDNEQEEPNAPLHVATNTFETVSRALQENIIAHFIRRPFIEKVLSQDQDESSVIEGKPHEDVQTHSDVSQSSPERMIERTSTTDSAESRVDVKALLTEVEPTSPKGPNSSIVRMASGTLEAAKTSATLRKKLGFASVAGGIAGGVAGLCVAGPAGAVIGVKCGQTAGLLGVLLEGSMTVGVFVAGVAAGGFTAHHLQQQQERRVITIGEDGVKRKLLLVRPKLQIDPVWEEICAKARSSHASNRRAFGLLPTPQGKQKKERYQRDSDIVDTDETEIPTSDKVLLLVSRSLNDKQSLPGHVYKCLIQDYRERCRERDEPSDQEQLDVDHKENEISEQEGEETETFEEVAKDTDNAEDRATSCETNDETEPPVELTADEQILQETANKLRGRRQDTHAVIKHVTATLLEVRPGFAASPAVTEMSAAAVEGLVFGELYDSVFEEIVEETREVDEALKDKIREFDEAHASVSEDERSSKGKWISQPAVDSLLMLPEAHSAVDKLRYCVQFLELISVHFSLMSEQGSAMSADSLLKMVCQHIIAAKVPSLNAEIMFLEEFARDEQLLRGKEGYALVTLQASLHFLNTSNNFDRDIFGDVYPHGEASGVSSPL